MKIAVRVRTWLLIAAIGLALYIFSASSNSNPAWFEPSFRPVGVPSDLNMPFEEYVSSSRKTLEQVLSQYRYSQEQAPYVSGYSMAQVVDMRAPFQLPEQSKALCGRKEDGAGKGFLLVHGLTDSPYLLKGLANDIFKENPCALLRAVLLPGHGTIVGDTLQMQYQDWQAMTAYGVNSFTAMENIDSVYIVGFSIGSALAIKQVQDVEKSKKVKGLVLLSAALKANNDFAWLASYIKGVKPWLDKKIERDAARYSSFSTNAASQFYHLTKDIMNEEYRTDLPVLMAVSADDTTSDALAARRFFCQNITSERKQLLWYKGFATSLAERCAGIVEIDQDLTKQVYAGREYHYANVTHVGVSISPADAHYGVDGVYRHCKYYEKSGDDSAWQKCFDAEEGALFAEENVAKMNDVLQGNVWRRGTFNRHYEQLIQKILCFTQPDCAI